MDTIKLLDRLVEKKNLSQEVAQLFLIEVMKGNTSSIELGAILTAIRMKGETIDEIVGFIKAIRGSMIRVNLFEAIDVCGTGGDHAGTFNISTAVAFVVAGAGVKVAKHGNRAASSQCGSADVLEKLGVNLKISPQQAKYVFDKIEIVFLFAPLYHSAMEHISLVRRELKIRTVFNFLGPFVNPAAVTRQLIGVTNTEIAKKLAKVGKVLGYKHLLIVASEDGLDEVSISSKTRVFEIKNNSLNKFSINPMDYGFKKTPRKEIIGGDSEENARIIQEILKGQKGPKRDIVVLNSACALYVAGAVKDIADGIKRAEKSIDSGKAKLVLQNLINETQKYANHS